MQGSAEVSRTLTVQQHNHICAAANQPEGCKGNTLSAMVYPCTAGGLIQLTTHKAALLLPHTSVMKEF
eukprot:1148747-Pelagomonas_calceolata.AAC.2